MHRCCQQAGFTTALLLYHCFTTALLIYIDIWYTPAGLLHRCLQMGAFINKLALLLLCYCFATALLPLSYCFYYCFTTALLICAYVLADGAFINKLAIDIFVGGAMQALAEFQVVKQ